VGPARDHRHRTQRRRRAAQQDQEQEGQVPGRALGSPTVASATLAWVTRLFNWHAARSNKFVNPVVKGMLDKDDKPKSRDRFLSDAELRILWPHLTDTYGAVLKTALLTAQRFHKVSSMRHADLKDRETIPGFSSGTNGSRSSTSSTSGTPVVTRTPTTRG
jgi:hypothetical protein